MTAHGFTLLLCAGGRCRTEQYERAVAALREVVRTTALGVLVVSPGCVLGPFSCRLRAAGPVLVVQPCDARRRPTRSAVRAGPLCIDEDVAVVAAWLRAGRFDAALLPGRLQTARRTAAAAARN
ncbi:hypothetical protein [Pseudonocardia nigra]|uniref:hypothetical protein n=1 Tax=Pseudonocardia nigra TaxID=1921578 RepID=UPI001C602741|nr:hypothetical protein [Pseudonocardia nigra]